MHEFGIIFFEKIIGEIVQILEILPKNKGIKPSISREKIRQNPLSKSSSLSEEVINNYEL